MNHQLKDSGHLRNCTAFEQLVAVCSSRHERYRPSNTGIGLSAIRDLSDQAARSVSLVMSALNNYRAAVGLRTLAFRDMRRLGMRLANYYRSCGTSVSGISHLLAYNNKLQGRHPKPQAAPGIAGGTEKDVPAVHSTVQLSFDQQAQHFLSMIDLLKKEPAYQPQEAELTVEQLSLLHQQLLQHNHMVQECARLLQDARSKRDLLLYAPDTGIVDLSKAIKAYICGALGSDTSEYKHVRKLFIRR